MNKTSLTSKQARVLKIIGDYVAKNEESPTILEIKEFLDCKSLRTVTQYLEILERKGFVYRDKYAKRGIKVIGWKSYFDSDLIKIPVLGSAGCDNQTVFAEPTYGEFISVSRKIIGNNYDKDRVVGIKAIGNSMTESGINNSDIVLIEREANISNGDRVAVIIDDTAVIKKITFTESEIILRPDSKDPSYKPIVVGSDFHIFGKVIRVIKKIEEYDDIEIIPD